MNYSKLWLDVFCDGSRISRESGFGAEAGWVYECYELDVEGQSFQAERYATEARTARDLYVFSEATEEWSHVWGEDTQN